MASELDQFLSPADQTRVVDAIRTAEACTSGEIKIHVEPHCQAEYAYKRAVEVFSLLGLHKTRRRNAVLVYLASEDHRFSIIGDIGIHAEVGQDFWQQEVAVLSADLKRGAAAEGLIAVVTAIGERLARAFPPEATKENQLDDEISTGAGLKK